MKLLSSSSHPIQRQFSFFIHFIGDGKRIRVSRQVTLEGALVGTGFPYRSNTRFIEAYLEMLKAAMQSTAGVRRPGAAALDLAYVAAGRVDGFWEIGLSPWDTAAGVVILREAGGTVTDFNGAPHSIYGQELVASNGSLHQAMLDLLQEDATHS